MILAWASPFKKIGRRQTSHCWVVYQSQILSPKHNADSVLGESEWDVVWSRGS